MSARRIPITTLLVSSIIFMTSLPVTVWGCGSADYWSKRSSHSYDRSPGSVYRASGLRLRTDATDEGYYARVYIEDLDPKDFRIYIRRNRLVLETIQGNRSGRLDPDTRRAARWKMRFRKQLRLPYDADWERMTSSVNDGIMEIFIPRRMPYQATRPDNR